MARAGQEAPGRWAVMNQLAGTPRLYHQPPMAQAPLPAEAPARAQGPHQVVQVQRAASQLLRVLRGGQPPGRAHQARNGDGWALGNVGRARLDRIHHKARTDREAETHGVGACRAGVAP